MSNKTTLFLTFEENYKLLFRVVYSVAHDKDDSLDILQETFLRAFLHFNSKMSYTETLRWLITISKNTAKTHIKQNKTFEPLENYIDEIGVSDISFTDLFIYDLKKGSVVPNKLFDLLIMNIIDEISLSEISRKTNISYERLRYWRKKLINDLYEWIKEA